MSDKVLNGVPTMYRFAPQTPRAAGFVEDPMSKQPDRFPRSRRQSP